MSEHAPAVPGGPPRRGVRVRAAATGVVVLALLGVGAAVIAAIVTPGGETVAIGADQNAAGADAGPSSPGEPGIPAPGPAAARLVLHVHGAVVEPGLVELLAGARVVDAIAAARGPTDDADLDAVNLARVVVDGEQLYLPRVGEVPPPSTGAAGGGAGPGGAALVNLNTADAAALETLPGIGPALASRIIAWREQNGGFRAVDELLAVSGIGESTLAGFRDQVTV